MKQPNHNCLKLTTIVFDLDETILYRRPDAVYEANSAALKLLCAGQYDIKVLEGEMRQVYKRTSLGKAVLVPKKKQFDILLQSLGYDSPVDVLFKEYIEKYLSLVDLFPETKNTLARLSTHGLKMGIATNSPQDVAGMVISHFDIGRFFDFIITSSQIGFPKPSEQYAARLLTHIQPSSTIIVVGDGEEDAITAKMIGAKFAFVDRDKQRTVSADYILNDLSEILTKCLNSPRQKAFLVPDDMDRFCTNKES